MKKIYIILMIGILLFGLVGCGEVDLDKIAEENDGISDGNEVDTADGDLDDDNEGDGSEGDEEGEEDDEETDGGEATGPITEDIIIENFKAEPSDVTIGVGDNVKWTNEMPNFKHLIVIYPQREDGTYSKANINEKETTLTGESYTYTFSENGSYKWFSLTKADKVRGIITVE